MVNPKNNHSSGADLIYQSDLSIFRTTDSFECLPSENRPLSFQHDSLNKRILERCGGLCYPWVSGGEYHVCHTLCWLVATDCD